MNASNENGYLIRTRTSEPLFFSANVTDDFHEDGEDYEEDYEDDYGEGNASVNGEDYSYEEHDTKGTNGTYPQAGALRSTYV